MFEQTFKNIDDILHKDAGCSSELDYVEQTSWVLFIKYLDDFERDKISAAELTGKSYIRLIDEKFSWDIWAAPKTKDGKLDHHKALEGDDLKDFVDLKLFPYLKKFKTSAEHPDTIEYKIGEIFSELKNKILHGIEAPNIVHTNTLSENILDIEEKDRFDIILANPPFGGKERKEVQQNFPINTGETAFLFLQHFIKKLKAGGRAGIVIKNTFLSNSDNASISLRKELLQSCNLYTVLDLPGGTFTGAGVKTVVLFFEKGSSTKKTWFYQLNLDRNLGKTNPLNEQDLAEFVKLQKKKGASDNSWTLDMKDVSDESFDLSVKNPNKNDEVVLRDPEVIIAEIKALDKESGEILKVIGKLV